MWAHPWFFLGHAFPHFFLSEKTTRIAGTPTKQSGLVGCRGGKFLLVFQNVEVLSDAD